MDNRKAVLELKDVPPPPHHSPPSRLPQSFPLAPLSLPPPCLLPPPHVAQESHQKQPLPKQQQEGLSPKVSICTRCEYCSTDGLLGSRDSSSVAGTSTFHTAPSCSGGPIACSRFESCSVASSVYQYNHNLSCGNGTKATDSLLSLGFKPQLPSSVATSQPLSLHPYFPCCSGLRHSCTAVPPSCSQPGTFPSPAPSFISFPPAPLQGCSDCITCGVDCKPSLGTSQRSGDHPTSTTFTTSTTSTHCCSNSLKLGTGCGKGARFCQECLLKVGPALLYSLNLCYFVFACHECVDDKNLYLLMIDLYIKTCDLVFMLNKIVFLFCLPFYDFIFLSVIFALVLLFVVFPCNLQPKTDLSSESVVWPDIPVPQTASVPICNGCGTSSGNIALMSSTTLGKTGHKCG